MNDIFVIQFRKRPVFGLMDADDAARLLPEYRFGAMRSGSRWYISIVPRGSIGSGGAALHRFLLDAPLDTQVDHKNRLAWDNRRSNLRLATPTQNNANTRKRRTPCHSKFKGVSKINGQWRAYIRCQNKQIHLGLFESEEDAARAYNAKALELWGEFANLNPVTP